MQDSFAFLHCFGAAALAGVPLFFMGRISLVMDALQPMTINHPFYG